MYSFETKLRVRYSETDRMGYVYYGNYPQYYEVGRVELMRSLGFPYQALEDMGIIMPVRDLSITYIKPSFYDDELSIKTIVREMPASRAKFEYEISNSEGILLNKGETTLLFVNAESRRPMRAPEAILKALEGYFNE